MAQADDDRRRAHGSEDAEEPMLTPAEEAIVVAFRQKTLLPLDDVLGFLKDAIPNFSRSGLHRCLQCPHARGMGIGDGGRADRSSALCIAADHRGAARRRGQEGWLSELRNSKVTTTWKISQPMSESFAQRTDFVVSGSFGSGGGRATGRFWGF
jgi:hypothetical protein